MKKINDEDTEEQNQIDWKIKEIKWVSKKTKQESKEFYYSIKLPWEKTKKNTIKVIKVLLVFWGW